MLISDLIFQLQQIQDEHGNLPVKKLSFHGVIDGHTPRIEYLKILTGMQSTPRFWYNDDEKFKGTKVVSI